MRIAISTSGEGMAADIDARFGRAVGFMLFDTETNAWEYLENTQNLNAAQGAGIQAAQNVVDAGVNAVITGHCGPKAFRVLTASGVKIYLGQKGTVAEAFELYKKGELEEAKNADVEGHWV